MADLTGRDAVDVAIIQGEEARRLAYEEMMMNRPTQINPWGATTWEFAPTGSTIGGPGSGGGSGGGGSTAPPSVTNPGSGWQDNYSPYPGTQYGALPEPGSPDDPGPGTGLGAGDREENYNSWLPDKRGGGLPNNMQELIDAQNAAGGSQEMAMSNPYTGYAGMAQSSKMQAPTSPQDGMVQNTAVPNTSPWAAGAQPTTGQAQASSTPDDSWIPPTTVASPQSPGSGQWIQRETLNPVLQDSLTGQFEQQRNRSQLASQLSGSLGESMGQAHDFDQYGNPIAFDPADQRQSAEDAAYQRATSRLDPQFDQAAQELEISLRNKGLRPGDQAYESEMDRFSRSKNDAYETARLGATGEGRQETELGLTLNQQANALRSQQMQEDLFARGFTLDEINNLMEGQEIEGGTPSSQGNQTLADMLSAG